MRGNWLERAKAAGQDNKVARIRELLGGQDDTVQQARGT